MTAVQALGLVSGSKARIWLRILMVGVGICGIVGPVLPFLVLLPIDAFRQTRSFPEVFKALALLPYVWPFAVVLMGPGGSLLGVLGVLWIRFRSQKVLGKRLFLEALFYGASLGSAVPLTTVVYGRLQLDSLLFFLGLGSPTGAVCAVLVYLAMRKCDLFLPPTAD